MSVINANPLMLGDAGYNIQRSLRFRSSASAYLSRTPASASSRTTWTLSFWAKLGSLSASDEAIVQSGASAQPYTLIGVFTANAYQLQWDEINTGSVVVARKFSTQVFRDTSAWYHVVLVWDTTNSTSTERQRVYINGNRVTAFSSSTDPALNAQSQLNSNVATRIGSALSGSSYFDGYLAEVNFIDGQTLTPSSFGSTNPVTGVWQPAKYTGTYGTNGFYLPFTDNSSPTTLGYDKSGNGNNWTPNNISTTAGVTYDSMTDVPTLTSAAAANYCTLNPLKNFGGSAISDGNLKAVTSGTAGVFGPVFGTVGMQSGKFYWEIMQIASTNSSIPIVGIANDATSTTSILSGYAQGFVVSTSDVLGLAFDADSGSLSYYKNGVLQGSATTGIPSTTYYPAASDNGGIESSTLVFNFGQRPFSYTPPTGFKALNTFNLPDPVIKKPNQYMDATTYTGNNTTNNVVNSGAFQPDFAWIKCRSTGSTNNMLLDSVRPNGYSLNSNTTNSEGNFNGPWTGFNSNGFGLGADGTGAANANGATYVGWQWKKGATPGFDIVTYTGNGANRTVSHSLGVAPKLMFVKRRDSTSDWSVYYNIDGLGAGVRYLQLNTTSASVYDTTYWNSTTATSSVFSLGTAGAVNTNAATYVAYLFAEIPGFSKFGSYIGNGSADGPFVYCGFRPKFIMVKDASQATQWNMIDTSRDKYNVTVNRLFANLSNAEATGINAYDINSNGFKIRNSDTGFNASGDNYIFAAFAENPFKYSLAR